MPLVFVSHASSDKPKLRPIIDALFDEGYDIFFDNPNKLRPRYSREERRTKFKRLKNVADYQGQLQEALRQCDVVLGCLTPELHNDKRVWEDELKFGLTADKLVCCRLGDFASSDLPKDVGGMLSPGRLQGLKVDPDLLVSGEQKRDRGEKLNDAEEDAADNLETILDDIRDLLEGVDRDRNDANAESLEVQQHVETRISSDAVLAAVSTLPRIATVRTYQAAVNARSVADVTPFLVAGPHNEMVDMFARNTPTIGTNLGRDRDDTVIYEVTASLSSSIGLDDQLFEGLNLELNPPVDPSIYAVDRAKAIAGSLQADKRASKFIVYSPVGARELEAGLDPVRAWLSFWAGVRKASTVPLAGVVPVLPIVLDSAKPGWDLCDQTRMRRDDSVPEKLEQSGILSFWREKRCANAELHAGLTALSRDSEIDFGISASYLPLLTPLRWSEIRADLKKAVDEPNFTQVRKKIKRFFRKNERGGLDFDGSTVREQWGVPMEEFHRFFSDLLNREQHGNTIG